MNERDKELARQAWTENDWDGHVDIPKLIDLIRADEREACAKMCESHVRYPSRLHFAQAIRERGIT
jgi:hypothetical protein